MMQLMIDHLWQSTLFALAAGLFTFALRSNAAGVRYWIWFAASIKFLIPFSWLAAVGGSLGVFVSPPVAASSMIFAMDLMAAPASPVAGTSAAALLILVRLAGFVIVLGAWIGQYLRIAALARAAEAGNITGPLPVKFVSAKVEPGLVGFARPVLLMPAGIVNALTADEMKSILAHEISHLHRRDNLTAAIHMLVPALFWFHPLVWWIGAKLVEERERACDESVLESGNDAGTYAEAILKVCKFYVRSPLICASGVSGADLKMRVEQIMTNRKTMSLGIAKKFVLALVALGVLATPVALGWTQAPIAPAAGAEATKPAFGDIVIAPRTDPRRPNAGADHIYPPESKAAREEGTTVLLLTVDATGDVIDAKVDQSSGHERLDDASRAAAINLWRFLPGTRNARPETMQMRIRITFALDRSDATPK